MNRTLLANYRVADLLEWHRDGRLELNPDFQRGQVWASDARSYLVDSLLRGYPIPKIFLRTTVDPRTQQTTREVVDGQQRLRAIVDFASNRFRLTKRAGEYVGLTYEQLDDETKESLLSYSLVVEQIISASNEEVLEVFARLNTYTVPLSPQEQRHAKYGGEFKFAVRNLSRELRPFFDFHRIFTLHGRVRMLDDQLTAEMLGILMDGIRSAGRGYLDDLYDDFDHAFIDGDARAEEVRSVINAIEANLPDVMGERFFARPPQLLMLFAAVAHLVVGLPAGGLEGAPPRPAIDTIDWTAASARLLELSAAVGSTHPPQPFVGFVQAVGGATTRLPSRRARFAAILEALVAH